MEGESITPSSDGNAPLSVESGANAIADLLSGKSSKTTPEPSPRVEPDEDERETASDDMPDNASEEEGDETQSDDEPDQPEVAEEPRYQLPDGREVTLKQLQEWEKGALRQADYTRKTQELAEQRKQAETRLAEAAQKAQHFEANLNLAIGIAEQYLPPEPDPAMLDTDPIGFIQAQAARQAKLRELQGLYAARQEHATQQQQERTQQFTQWAQKEAETLLDKLPQLRDPAKLSSFQKDVQEYLPKFGYTAEDLAQVHDHRLVVMIDKAIKYDKLMSQKPKVADKVKDATPVQPAGKRPSPAAAKERETREKMDRLRRSGSIEDGAAAILQRLRG